MSVRSPAPAPAAETFGAFAVEQTDLGPQTLVPGVQPITPRDRLTMRANAPMEPRRAQRARDHGLFDTNARNQLELFAQLPSPTLDRGDGGG